MRSTILATAAFAWFIVAAPIALYVAVGAHEALHCLRSQPFQPCDITLFPPDEPASHVGMAYTTNHAGPIGHALIYAASACCAAVVQSPSLALLLRAFKGASPP